VRSLWLNCSNLTLVQCLGSVSTAYPEPKVGLGKEEYRAIVDAGSSSPARHDHAVTSTPGYTASFRSTLGSEKQPNRFVKQEKSSAADELIKRFSDMGYNSTGEMTRGESRRLLKCGCVVDALGGDRFDQWYETERS
jgi:hypothetical protein